MAQVARPSRGLLAGVGSVTLLVLMLNTGRQLYDSNLVFAWEATSLLAGDRLYHELFEWGAPLSAYLSAAAQLLVGYRLIGEFALQWLFICGGVMVAFHLGCRLSGSVAATCAVLPLVWLVMADTPPYHYSKIFVFPVALWAAWRHVERPSARTSAVLGALTAVAFLFRHDYLFYVAPAGALALVLAPAGTPTRRLMLAARHALVCAAVALVCVAPWLLAVQSTEGLANYTRLRAEKYEGAPPVYRTLLAVEPVRQLTADPVPAPQPGVVGFVWQPGVPEERQREIEQQLNLRRLDTRDKGGRLQFGVANLYDPRLLDLDPYINDGDGFVSSERLTGIRTGLPSHDNVGLWLQQVTLLVSLLLLAAALAGVGRALAAGTSVPVDVSWMAVAAVLLILANRSLLRERSYVVAVFPLTMTLGARFIARPRSQTGGVVARAGATAAWIVACALLVVTTYAAAVWARQTPMFRPASLEGSLRATADILLGSPPAVAYEDGRYRYLQECTKPGDRLLAAGMTPFDISYSTGRPVAGGHLYWHTLWGADPVNEARSLALLQRQSVPFAVAPSGTRVLEDLKPYPRIHEYIATNYREVEGRGGSLLVDTRRKPTGTFGEQRLPCFK